MSTSGSKSNEHVAHFLVDIHMVQRVLYRIDASIYSLGNKSIPQSFLILFYRDAIINIIFCSSFAMNNCTWITNHNRMRRNVFIYI